MKNAIDERFKSMPNEKIKWLRPHLEKEMLVQLRERSDKKAFFCVMSRLLLSFATGTLSIYSWYNFAWPWTLFFVYVHGMFYTFLGEHAGVHELSHGTVFKHRFWNKFFLRICAFMTWSNYVKYQKSHTQHHMATCFTGRDLEVIIPYKVTTLDWISYATVDYKWAGRTLLTTLRHAFGIVHGEWEERLFPEAEIKARRELFGWARFVLVGHITLLCIVFYFKLWPLIVLFTFGGMYATWLAWLVSHPQHLGMKPDTPDFRLSTRSVKVHPFVKFLHWNMDYHVEHHMYASVPFYNLPAMNKQIRKYLPEPRGLWKTWTEDILLTLRRQKTDPDYTSVPIMPNIEV